MVTPGAVVIDVSDRLANGEFMPRSKMRRSRLFGKEAGFERGPGLKIPVIFDGLRVVMAPLPWLRKVRAAPIAD
jgi:hypothetical protein